MEFKVWKCSFEKKNKTDQSFLKISKAYMQESDKSEYLSNNCTVIKTTFKRF